MTTAPLVLAAHGSSDPRFAEVISDLAAQVRLAHPNLDVRVGFLDHGPPLLEDVATAGAVVVPVLLTNGFHVRSDIPARAPGCVVTPAVGPDQRLTAALVERLAGAGWDRQLPLVLAAAGSADPRAVADVHQTARELGDALGLAVEPGFLSAAEPRLADLAPAAVATYLLAPGAFADAVAECGAAIVAPPVGAHPVLAEIILDRYAAATA